MTDTMTFETHESVWRCGDGCCSEHSWSADIFSDGKLIESFENCASEEQLIEFIKEKYPNAVQKE